MGVVCVIMWVQSGFSWVCWLFKCGSVRVVKGVWIWRHKKRARNQLQKREAEVTSTGSPECYRYGPGACVGTVSTHALSSLGDGGFLPYGLPILSLNVCTRRGAALLWVTGC